MPQTIVGKSVWKLHCDARKRQYRLVIRYASTLPPRLHEEVHDRMRKEALRFLDARGIDPSRAKVEIHCDRLLACEDEPEVPAAEIPCETEQDESPNVQQQPQDQDN